MCFRVFNCFTIFEWHDLGCGNLVINVRKSVLIDFMTLLTCSWDECWVVWNNASWGTDGTLFPNVSATKPSSERFCRRHISEYIVSTCIISHHSIFTFVFTSKGYTYTTHTLTYTLLPYIHTNSTPAYTHTYTHTHIYQVKHQLSTNNIQLSHYSFTTLLYTWEKYYPTQTHTILPSVLYCTPISSIYLKGTQVTLYTSHTTQVHNSTHMYLN